jgi:Zn-dependent M28 family amino/carboxypeptidase
MAIAQPALPQEAALRAAEQSIDAERMRAHVRFLADDLLEGRGPGLRGAEIATKYIATQFALDGLKPGGDNGTYLQQIDFVGVKAIPAETNYEFVPLGGGTPVKLAYGDDYTVSNQQHKELAEFNAPLVFVGFGVTAPEYGWNDYAGVDVKGKVIVCIVGDPPSDDPKFFAGKALTYYGRWTYKFEEAARQGAIGALIIHRTDYASYGWGVVNHSNTSEKTYLRDDKNPKLQAASWIQLEVARKLFAASGLDLDKEMLAAGQRGFKAHALPFTLKAHVKSTIRPFQSANVVGILPASGPAAGHQAIMYTAHYDHLGFVPGMAGDNVYNGAVDNGTGCGILLEMARAWAASGLKPPAPVIFSAVTAEEQGLLGSEYLGQHPPVPPASIGLDINYDALAPIAGPQEVNVNGAQRTNFYPEVQAAAKQFGLTIVPDPEPEAGGYYRSDHFSLSRVGIPAFSVDPGTLYEGHDHAWGAAQAKDYNDNRYHNFSDNYTPDMDFTGNAKLARFGMQVGWQALNASKRIEWNHGDEFEAARLASEKR